MITLPDEWCTELILRLYPTSSRRETCNIHGEFMEHPLIRLNSEWHYAQNGSCQLSCLTQLYVRRHVLLCHRTRKVVLNEIQFGVCLSTASIIVRHAKETILIVGHWQNVQLYHCYLHQNPLDDGNDSCMRPNVCEYAHALPKIVHPMTFYKVPL